MVLPFGEGIRGKLLGNISTRYISTYIYMLGGSMYICGSPYTDMHICTLCAALGYSVADFLN